MRKMIVAAMAALVIAAVAFADTTYRYEDVVQNTSGRVVGGASITVYDADTSTQATIYKGIDTSIGAKANPTSTDNNGRYWFYALPGRYDILIERAGIESYTREDVYVGGFGSVSSTAQVWPSIKDLGATGNGTSADRDSMQAMIDLVYDSGASNGNILVPNGRYLINVDGATSGESTYGLVLYDGITLIGEPGAVFVLATQQGSGAEPYPESHLIYADGATGIGVIGIEFDLQEDTQPSGDTHDISAIKFNDCSDIVIEGCKFDGGVMNAVSIYGFDEGLTNLRFTDNDIIDANAGLYMFRVLGASIDNLTSVNCVDSSIHTEISSHVSINNLRASGTFDNGILLLGSGGTTVDRSSIINASGYGISVGPFSFFNSAGTILSLNRISMNTSSGDAGIYVENSSSTTLVGNEISGSNWDGVDSSANIGGIVGRQTGAWSLSDFVITGNVIKNIDRNYPGGLVVPPAAISIKGDGGEVRGISIGDNAIDNSYVGLFLRPTGARATNGGTIRNCATSVDTVQVADIVAPSVIDSTGTTYSITNDIVWINWSATLDEPGTADVTWYNNGTATGVFSEVLSLSHGGAFSTSKPDVQDDTFEVTATFTDVTGNISDSFSFGTVSIDTIPADPSDTTAPVITNRSVTNDISGGYVDINWSCTTSEDNGAMSQVRYRIGSEPFSTLAFDSTLTNTRSGLIETFLNPSEGDEYDVYIYLEDSSGNNTGWAPLDSTVIDLGLDTLPPVISGTTYSISAPDGGSVSLYWTAVTDEDAYTMSSYSRNGGTYTDLSWSPSLRTSHSTGVPTSITSVDGDTYALRVRAQDPSGNTSSWTDMGTRTVSISASGDPAITSVVPGLGGFNDGTIVTIYGSNFGIKSPAAPQMWDDFEGGSNGGAISSPSVGSYSRFNDATYTNSNPASGNYSSYQIQVEDGSIPSQGAIVSWSPDTAQSAFAAMKFRIISSSGSSYPHNIKLLRHNTGYPDVTHGSPNFNITKDINTFNYLGIINHGSGHQDWWGGGTINENGWNHFQSSISMSDDGVANGYVSRFNNGTFTELTTASTYFSDLDGGFNGTRQVYFCGYISHNGHQTELYLDDLYADNTLARAFIGDASTMANCTTIEMLIPTQWDNSFITASIHSGSFSDGDNVYVFVVNEDGTVSAGEAITIGGTSASPPSGVIAFGLDENPFSGGISVTGTTSPLGSIPDAVITGQWREVTDTAWTPTDTTAYYVDTYTPIPGVGIVTGMFASSPLDTIEARFRLKGADGLESSWQHSGNLIFGTNTDTDPPSITRSWTQLSCSSGDAYISSFLNVDEPVSIDMRYSYNGGAVINISPDTTPDFQGTSIRASFQTATPCSAGDYYDMEVYLSDEAGNSTGQWIAMDRVTVPSTAEPAITNLTGDWDGSLTLTGTNFGGKTTAAPVEWETWQSYSSGELEVIQSKWNVSSDNPDVSTRPHVSQNKPRYTGDKNLYLHIPTTVGTGEQWDLVWSDAYTTVTDTLFISFWANTETPSTGTRNQKFFSLSGQFNSVRSHGAAMTLQRNEFGDNYWNLYFLHRASNSPENLLADCDAGGFGGGNIVYGSFPQVNLQWYRVTLQLVIGAACDVDGGFFRTYSHLESDSSPFIWDEDKFSVVEDSDDSWDLPNQVVMKAYLDHVTGYDLSATNYYDDMYVDNTWSRVEVGNASTYDQCTHVEMLPATAWTNTSITVTGNAGSFADSESVWVFVFNDKGVPSSGYSTTIGTGAPPPPDVPVINSYVDSQSTASGTLVSMGLIGPDVSAQAIIQWRKWYNGTWAPSDTTDTGAWTVLTIPAEGPEFSLDTGYTPVASDSIHFRATIRNAAGVHAGVWTQLDSYYEPAGTSATWLWGITQGVDPLIGDIDPALYDTYTYGVGTEGAVTASDTTFVHGTSSGDDWQVKIEAGGGINYQAEDDGSFYLWYPGPIGTTLAGKTVSSATLHLRTYNFGNDLTAATEGLVITAITNTSYNDHIAVAPWTMAWAYPDSLDTGTAWSANWSMVDQYSDLGTSTTYSVDMTALNTDYAFDVTSLVQAAITSGANFGGFAIHLVTTGATYIRLRTADGSTVANHPALEVTTE